MVEHSGHLQLSPRGSPVVLPGRRSTKRRPGESTPSGNNQQLHPPMSQDRNRQRGVATEDNASGVLYVTLNLQQRSGGRPARTEEPPSEYAAIRVKWGAGRTISLQDCRKSECCRRTRRPRFSAQHVLCVTSNEIKISSQEVHFLLKLTHHTRYKVNHRHF